MKYLLKILLVLTVCVSQLKAVELVRSVSVADGERLSAAKLLSLIDGTTVGTAFYTDKPSKNTMSGADYILVFDPSLNAYRVITANTAILQNTNIITSQPVKAVPVSTDLILIYDSIGGVLSQVSVNNLILTATNSIAGLRTLDIPNQLLFTFPEFSGATNYQGTFSNLFTDLPPSLFKWTNLLTSGLGHVTNGMSFLVYDPISGSNQLESLAGLFTNASPLPVWTNGARLLAQSTNGNAAGYVTKEQFFADSDIGKFSCVLGTVAALGAINGQVTSTNHGFGKPPSAVSWVIRCNTAEFGYIIGDEVQCKDVVISNGGDIGPKFTQGSDTNAVWIIGNLGTVPALYSRTNGALNSITQSRWNYKVYATR